MHRFKVNSLQKLLIHINFLLAFSVLFCSHSAFGQSSDQLYVNGINVDSRAVDLGLSVYWAKYNLGAIDSTSQGSFIYGYAINGTWTDSSWPNWRIPKKIEIDELRSNTNFSNGFFTSNNRNSIRVPMMHYKEGGPNGASSISDGWMFWSCSFDNYLGWPVSNSIDAYVLRYKKTVQTTTLNRANGLPIRFVIDKVTITLKSGNTTISKSFPKGSTIQIGVYRDDCHTFLHWIKDNDTAHPLTMANPFEIFADVTYEAVFEKKQYKITTAVGSNGGGSVNEGNEYYCGELITLTATPDACHQFKQWIVNKNGQTSTIAHNGTTCITNPTSGINTLSITVDGAATYTAEFEDKKVTISTNVIPDGGGFVSGGGDYYCNASNVSLTATPNECYEFEKWSDDITENPRSLTVTQDMTLTAVFTVKTTNLEATTEDNTKGSVGLKVGDEIE